MKNRSIKMVIPAQKVNMGGHLLDQPLPVRGIDQIDPFLLIHHWQDTLPGDERQQDIGVGPHPHRGFSPVTFVFKGNLEHRDSMGNRAVVHEGGTQWMHAGRGITHSERPGKDMAENGGELEFIQFWVNTPAESKMQTPDYLPLSESDTPKWKTDGVELAVVAGEYKGIKGPAQIYSPLLLLRGIAQANSAFEMEIPETYNAIIYVLEGELQINDTTIKDKDMVWLEKNGEGVEIQVKQNSRFILLSGEPIEEEVSSYGPFVMNTQTEIMEALRDAQMGKMGVLIEEFD